MSRPLFSRYPGLEQNLPFIALGDFPTPIRSVATLGKQLNVGDLRVKCDDISAADYGGNKIRKLEFLLADAKARNRSTVITFGGMGSNHALATSINCARLGLDCVAVLTPEPVTDAVRSTLRYHQHLGTRLELARYGDELRATADQVARETGAESCYEIPFGGSSWVGATGFVNAALELAEQIETGELPLPDIIYIACGTSGSIAGLALGLQLAGLDIAIEAIQVTPDAVDPQRLYADLFGETNRQLRQRHPGINEYALTSARINIRKDQLGKGYAIPTAAGREAAELMQNAAGIGSSLTYTAKAMAGLVADASTGTLCNKKVLFWNTYNSHPYPEFPTELDVGGLPPSFRPYFD